MTTYISIKAAAERYAVSPRTIRRRIADGSLPAVYASSRLIRVNEDALDLLFQAVPAVAA